MSDTKFTPGPWRVSNNGQNGKKTPTFRIWRNDSNQPDGDNFRNTGYASISSHVSGEANARLIAAAPELYEALEKFQAFYPMGINPYLDDAYRMAMRALAKARGES